MIEQVSKYLIGKVQDLHNLIRECRKNDMYLQQMTMQEMDMEAFVIMKRNDELPLKAPEIRRQHLKNRLQVAKDQQDEKAAKDILQILHQTADKKCSQRANRSVGKPRCGQVLLVRLPGDNGGTEEFTTKFGVYMAVENNLSKVASMKSAIEVKSMHSLDNMCMEI